MSNMRRSILVHSICAALAAAAGGAGAADSAAPRVVAREAAAAPSILALRAGSFDPLVAPLAMPDASLSIPRESSYGVVQFKSKRMPSQSRLAALGIDVIAYLPEYAYLVRWNGARDRVAALPETRWTGAWLPGYKIDPALWSSNATDLTLIGFPGTNADRFSATLTKRVPGLVRIARYDDPQQPRVHVRVPPASLNKALLEVANLDEVLFIERYAAPRLLNDDSYGPIQANVASDPSPAVTNDTPIWNRGLTGSGQIVTVADSGLDRNHCAFVQLDRGNGVVRAFTDADDPATNPAFAPPNVANLYPDRKILGYWVQPGATAYDNTTACVSIGGIPNPTSFHGTHVVGTVLGDRGTPSTPTSAGYDEESDPVVGTEVKPGDGMAPNAQVLFQDIGNDDTGCLSGIGVLDDMFEQAHRGGARLHSNSWGAATAGVYTGFDADADRGTYQHEDMLVLFAAGNDGDEDTTIGSPGNAKNVLTVGANSHGNASTIASFSSRGPTADGRVKPDVTAPGSGIVSAQGDTINSGISLEQVESLQCGAQSLSGTSMSTPTVAGGAALMRQYFAEGFYPTGARAEADRYAPSGALMKAVLMNGTSAPAEIPSTAFGWGRIWLDSNLYFPGDDRKLRHFDVPNAAGLETGEQQSWTIEVPAGTPRELRATLTWLDPPGTPASARSLVNDLDLEVVAPDGTYLGNVFDAGASIVGGEPDDIDNTEVVRLPAAAAGTYTIRVKGSSVPGSGIEGSTRQGYALAVTGATCETEVTATPAAPSATDLGLAGISVALTPPSNAATTQVYRAQGTCETADADAFRLIGATAGGTFVDAKVTGGFPYAYRVRGADACGEGPVSSCTSVLSTAACDLAPTFDVESVTVTNDPEGETCGTLVEWTAGAPRCPASDSVRYNVYRSTDFDFTPGPENLVASGVEGTSYRDVAVDPLQTYFYVVRAEDLTTDGTGPANGGNESLGLKRVNAVAYAAPAPGTFADSVDVAAYMRVEAPWSISDDRASDGTLSYRTAADGTTNYLPEQCAAITTPPILLGDGAALSYDARYELEDQWDGVVVEISDDGGTTWNDLPPSPFYPSTFAQTQAPPVNACGYAATHGAFGGSSGGAFDSFSSSLSSYAGETVQLRWRFSSDPATELEGFYLDKVRVTNAAQPQACTRLIVTPPVDPLFQDGFEAP